MPHSKYELFSMKSMVQSFFAFVIGLVIPIGIKHWFHDDNPNHEPFWVVLEFFSGIFFLTVEKVLHSLHQVMLNQEANADEITNSIALKINTANSIFKFPIMNNSYVDNYFKSLGKLHKSVNDNVKTSPHLITLAYELLNVGTENLSYFFGEGREGVYRTLKAVEFYERIANNAVSIYVIEPTCPVDYDHSFSKDYIDFIEKIGLEKKIRTKYYFIKKDTHKKTYDWLKTNNFDPATLEFKGKQKEDHEKWKSYSHLVFEFAHKKYVSCSVLPIYNSMRHHDSKPSSGNLEFKEAKDVYFAFRIFDKIGHNDELSKFLYDALNLNAN